MVLIHLHTCTDQRFVLFVHVLDPSFFFFFNDTATTEIYTLSLHDALPISTGQSVIAIDRLDLTIAPREVVAIVGQTGCGKRSEEHTSELQSLAYLVCRLLLEKKKKKSIQQTNTHAGRRYPNTSRIYSPLTV